MDLKFDFKFKFDFNPSHLKRYASLLIPVGVVLVACVFVLLTVMSSRSLAKSITDKSLGTSRRLDSVRKKVVSSEQAEEEQRYQDRHKKDAVSISKLAVATTLRDLLSYDVFPKPEETSSQIYSRFGDNFRKSIKSLLLSINAHDAPTQDEITSATRSVAGGNSRDQSQIDAICQTRSDQASVYADPDVFGWYDYWNEFEFKDQPSAVEDCWYSQVCYWVYEDVVSTVKSMNQGSSHVGSSDFKRLLNVNFTGSNSRLGRGRAAAPGRGVRNAGGKKDVPEYVQSFDVAKLGAIPWTARKCDDKIDVIHFKASMIVSTSAIPRLFEELCAGKEHVYRKGYRENGDEITATHNQITILEFSSEAVDRFDNQHEYYRYGDAAVSKVDVVCEYIFNRKGYDQIKPDSVKELLGQLEEVAGGGLK